MSLFPKKPNFPQSPQSSQSTDSDAPLENIQSRANKNIVGKLNAQIDHDEDAIVKLLRDLMKQK